MRISGNSNDVDFWRLHFRRPPLVTLNGNPVGFVCEARSGDDGYVVVEIIESGKPVLANVVLPDGRVIGQIIARETLRGSVQIEPLPELLS